MKTKKSLGQNFFINKNLCKQITEIVLKEKPEIIVEIGPGPGSFTQFFYELNVKLILVEKDNQLSEGLKLTYPNSEIENVDFLDWNLNNLEKYRDKKIIFFGSLPYNVSKRIIAKIIESKHFLSPSFFIIQKEVAEKYISKEPDNNLLSLKTKIYAKPQRLFNISPDSFRPKPKVNSSFVVFNPKRKQLDIDINDFKRFLKISFSQPRKTLKNNLKSYKPKLGKNSNGESINKLLSKRPQHLSFEEFVLLYNNH